MTKNSCIKKLVICSLFSLITLPIIILYFANAMSPDLFKTILKKFILHNERTHFRRPILPTTTIELSNVNLMTKDDHRIGCLLIEPIVLEERHEVILLLHGNACNRLEMLDMIDYKTLSQNFVIMIPDYRGFGDSVGEFTVEGVNLDVQACVRFLSGRFRRKISIVGFSLGGGVALEYAKFQSEFYKNTSSVEKYHRNASNVENSNQSPEANDSQRNASNVENSNHYFEANDSLKNTSNVEYPIQHFEVNDSLKNISNGSDSKRSTEANDSLKNNSNTANPTGTKREFISDTLKNQTGVNLIGEFSVNDDSKEKTTTASNLHIRNKDSLRGSQSESQNEDNNSLSPSTGHKNPGNLDLSRISNNGHKIQNTDDSKKFCGLLVQSDLDMPFLENKTSANNSQKTDSHVDSETDQNSRYSKNHDSIEIHPKTYVSFDENECEKSIGFDPLKSKCDSLSKNLFSSETFDSEIQPSSGKISSKANNTLNQDIPEDRDMESFEQNSISTFFLKQDSNHRESDNSHITNLIPSNIQNKELTNFIDHNHEKNNQESDNSHIINLISSNIQNKELTNFIDHSSAKNKKTKKHPNYRPISKDYVDPISLDENNTFYVNKFVIVGSFSSILDICNDFWMFKIGKYLLRGLEKSLDFYDSKINIKSCEKGSVAIIHSAHDQLIDLKHGVALSNAAGAPLHVLNDYGHVETIYAIETWRLIREFLKD